MTKKPARPAKAQPDDTDLALIDFTEELLGEHFFDPDAEEAYKASLADARTSKDGTTLLLEETVEILDSDCTILIQGLRAPTMMRVTLSHPDFGATIQGSWSFDMQELKQPKVVERRGEPIVIEAGLEALAEQIFGSVTDEDMEELLDELGEADDEEPLIGDDPKEPPAPTGTDQSRVKSIAKWLARAPTAGLGIEDRGWLEETPQSLPVIVDLLISAAESADAEDPLVLAYLDMLALQLEFVRYRQDRGWDWASTMLDDFQQRMLAFGQAGGDTGVFMAMGRALVQARVPVAEEMRQALTEVGVGDEEAGPPEQLTEALDVVMSQLASMMDSPFEVIAALQTAGAIFPANMRGFLADRLAHSDYAVIRKAVVLMLLDKDAAVRTAAAAALTETASPATMSPDTLRRAITLRNWIPEAEREAVDTLVRKARLAGVEIAPWPAALEVTEYHASMIDGSGAQSLLMLSRDGKKSVFNALLLRHGEGIIDAWEQADLSRSKATKMLREVQQAAIATPVSRGFIDLLVQHLIGVSAERGSVPPEALLEVAESVNGAAWKARRLDLVAETERLFAELPAVERTEAETDAAMHDAAEWLIEAETLRSWFEEGPQVHETLSKLSRTNRPGLIAATLKEILPANRAAWAEKFLLMALWCRASTEAKYQRQARGMLTVAHALLADQPMERIPPMAVIASQTITKELVTPW